MSKVLKTVLELAADEAREYMLKSEQYCTFRLPEYFVFDKVLALASTVIGRKDESQCYVSHTDGNGKTKIEKPSDFDEVNYLLYSNKDGKLDYRPLTLINPYYYYLLVRMITNPDAWKEITERFEALRDPHISVESVIVADDEYKEKKTIINWWSRVEQQSIELSLQYKYLFITDITNCYGSIYTHSIAWAMMGKEEAKRQKGNRSLLGNRLDTAFQGMQYGQTNSIPQGNVVSDLIAELILSYADSIIAKKAKESCIEDYKIIRYRDDYRVFCNDKNDIEKLSLIMQKELAGLNFKINSSKTCIVEDLVLDSIKKDKVAVFDLFLHRKGLEEESEPNLNKSLLQKELLSIYAFAKQYPNSGSVERLLGDVYDWFNKIEIKDCNWKVLVAILISIAKDNPRTYGIVAAIISLFVDRMVPEERMELIQTVYDKVSQWPNSSLLLIWLQRITLKIDKTFKYDERLCKLVASENECIWKNDWLEPSIIAGFSNDIIISREVIDKMKVTIDKQAVSPFYQSSDEESEE